jgi:hypothetical protein
MYVKRSILFGQGNFTNTKSDAKPRSVIRDLKQNKHQLVHRLANVRTTLIYNRINKSHNTEGGHREVLKKCQELFEWTAASGEGGEQMRPNYIESDQLR